MKLRLLVSLLFASALAFLPLQSLSAQIACNGSVCSSLPVSQAQYDQLYRDFYDQYVKDFFDRMAYAAVLGNLASPYIGTVNLYGWTAGANVGAGYRKLEEKTVSSPGVGQLEDIPSAGASVNSRVFFGINLGALTGNPYDPFNENRESSPGFFSLSRFDVYVSGIRHSESFEDQNGLRGDLNVRMENRGAELRYHLAEASDIAMGPILRFRGISVGIGYYASDIRLRYATTTPESTTLRLEGGTALTWAADDLAEIKTSVQSVPIDIRTGVQLLYIFNVTFGFGLSRNTGNLDALLLRGGAFALEPNPAIPSSLSGQSANLTMTVQRYASVPRDVYFIRTGVELNLGPVKVGVEALGTREDYAASANLRLEL
ncbi:MAG: hypothetical protein K1X75_01985 [Leptospirales bacterium]|nr:hypothetical protein [Leptospirales bacterium]